MTNNLIGFLLAIIGTWVATDGIYSWTLYLNAPSYEGSPRQTFWKDHYIRLIRIILGISTIILGYLII